MADPAPAPDGYCYGVMYDDGSVARRWNGRTQRQRAQEAVEWYDARYPGHRDRVTLARCRPGQPWERVETSV